MDVEGQIKVEGPSSLMRMIVQIQRRRSGQVKFWTRLSLGRLLAFPPLTQAFGLCLTLGVGLRWAPGSGWPF
jgi:hypothetical protein